MNREQKVLRRLISKYLRYHAFNIVPKKRGKRADYIKTVNEIGRLTTPITGNVFKIAWTEIKKRLKLISEGDLEDLLTTIEEDSIGPGLSRTIKKTKN